MHQQATALARLVHGFRLDEGEPDSSLAAAPIYLARPFNKESHHA
jgi:hypothetical protein